MLTAVGAIGIATPEQLAGQRGAAGRRRSTRAPGISWAAWVLALGALVAITSVILVIMYGQTRIFFAMCRDGLMPERLAKVQPALRHPGRADASASAC